MTKVVTLEGVPIEDRDGLKSADALTVLKTIVAKIESGELKIEEWILVFQSPVNGQHLYQSLDSKLSVETAVLMLEGAKLDIINMWKLAK